LPRCGYWRRLKLSDLQHGYRIERLTIENPFLEG
jgi:hypothetical protein